MSFENIAGILKMRNLWQVRRKLQKALKILGKELRKKGIGPDDLDLL